MESETTLRKRSATMVILPPVSYGQNHAESTSTIPNKEDLTSKRLWEGKQCSGTSQQSPTKPNDTDITFMPTLPLENSAKNLLDRVQERTESRVGKPAPIGPIKKRDQEKLNGADAAIAKANGALFTSATFLHSAVINQRFDAALVAYFAHADNANEYVWGPGTIDALDNARQTITASIANHHADYIVANQKAALRARGRSQVELKWWHANTSTAGSFSMDQNVENAAELVQTNNAHHTANTNDDTDHVTDASL